MSFGPLPGGGGGALSELSAIPLGGIQTNGSGLTLTPNPFETGSAQISLASSGCLPGVYGSGTMIPQFTLNLAGQITSISDIPVMASGSITVTTPNNLLTITGSPVSLGGTLTITNNALNAINTRSFIAAGATNTGLLTDSIFIGSLAQTSTVSNILNMGTNALASSNNIIRLGHLSVAPSETSPDMIYIGNNNLRANTSATGRSIIIGHSAGTIMTSCGTSVIIGHNAQTSGATTLSDSIIVGSASTMAAGTSNVVVGASVAINGASSTNNVVLGSSAVCSSDSSVIIGQNTRGGQNCVIVGQNSGAAMTSSSSNCVIIGRSSGSLITSGANNTCVGVTSGTTIPATSSGNTCIGASSSGNNTDGVSVGRASVCNGLRAIAIGTSSSATGTDCYAFGNNTNATANTTKIGSTTSATAHVVSSTGYFSSNTSDSIGNFNTATVATALPGVTRLTLSATNNWNDVRGGTALDTANNRLIMFQTAKTYLVTASVQITITVTLNTLNQLAVRLIHDNNGALTTLAAETMNTGTDNITYTLTSSFSMMLKTVSATNQRVYCEVERLQGNATTCNQTTYNLAYTAVV